jgi:hypothetical protein
MGLKICYIANNGTRRASDRKVKQAGLLFGIEKFFLNCYSIINSTCQAKATAGLFFDIKKLLLNFYNINNIPATPLILRANAQPGGYFFCGGLLGVNNVG